MLVMFVPVYIAQRLAGGAQAVGAVRRAPRRRRSTATPSTAGPG